jgi:hypothetical protein
MAAAPSVTVSARPSGDALLANTRKTIGYIYGGQGSMNTPGWPPDSKRIALVSNSKL